MIEYPKLLDLDGIYNRVRRDEKYVNRCFTDLTEEEQRVFLDTLTEPGLKRMCMELARTLRDYGEAVFRVEEERKRKAMRYAMSSQPEHLPTQKSDVNPMPFGYNADGSKNEQEAKVVQYVFAKNSEYFRNPPLELIEEAYAWAESEGKTLTEEEAMDMARARIMPYIAIEVQKKFPDVKYRQAAPAAHSYPNGLKYPSRPFKSEEIISRDLFAQVQDIISHA